MHHFYKKNGSLFCEQLKLDNLAEKYGTPLYVYSANTFREHYNKLNDTLAPLNPMICFAMKANSNLAVLRTLAKEGAGFDIVSGGELFRVLKAGGKAGKCVFAGVGKTDEEIAYALKEGIYAFHVESYPELEQINRVALKLKKVAPIAARVNPNVDADTHHKITTGTYENKFGIPFEEIPAFYAKASRLAGIKLRGVQVHIGSQITSVKPFAAAAKKMLPLVRTLKAKYGIEYFGMGGGLGIVYDPALESGSAAWWNKQKNPPLTPASYAKAIVPILKPLGLKVLLEPGRFISGNAGVLLAEVVHVKKTAKKNFVIVDAAMNDLIRPAFYESYHQIEPLTAKSGKAISSDVVGPICESGDTFCKNRPLPPLKAGDRVAFLSAGAYGFVMSSQYNSRPRAAELLVDGRKVVVARKRETLDDLIRGERAS
ncbi:MAG: diaminopimelate decarboxylase [Verrucomicrobiales bacterium]|jgi:diaminopimelate decarboxylase|nr:diaminopimelate decarboxylase [Verrucomicrobiales bacterium]